MNNGPGDFCGGIPVSRKTAIALLKASRPPTLLTGLAPVLLGNVLGTVQGGADGSGWTVWVVTLLVVILMQSGANLVNDVQDAESGVDGADRLGPQRITQSGLLPAASVRRAYRVVFILAALLGGLMVARGGLPLVLLGGCCLAAAWMYTAGPLPLSRFAMGEALALIFFGPVAVAGTSYLHTLRWSGEDLLVGLGPGFLAAALMAINNYRDVASDRRAGKHTLATLLGESRARYLPGIFLLLAVLVLWLTGPLAGRMAVASVAAALAVLVLFLLVFPRIRPGRGLNTALKRTSLFNLFYALLFAGVILA